MKKQRPKTCLIVLGAVILALSLTATAFGLAWPPEVEAGATLPPRQPPRSPQHKGDKDQAGSDSAGAYIELQLQPAQIELWTVVQWQDSAGGWQKVDGWQGPPESSGRQWWVAPKDFGKGPFRWVVTRGPGGPPAGVSAPFNLPVGAGQRVQVMLTLK